MGNTDLKAALAVTLALTSGVAAAQDARALQVRALAATCANCHGSEGRPPQGSALPPLAGIPAERFIERMQSFKSGAPGPTVMHQIAKGFNDAQIQQMAAYFAARQL
ncbi:MAG TPA: c-type cytochrome [Ideonella sp.]|uniref:c-type cytochrome n=1 Tax=Ideonella sp. TaxID=1929293 RepID=UPI002E36E2B5|nr:c-type cytochrome [Ideonella sp.]HEX5683973.1 c-type cytochrome [Ideonella sp.]